MYDPTYCVWFDDDEVYSPGLAYPKETIIGGAVWTAGCEAWEESPFNTPFGLGPTAPDEDVLRSSVGTTVGAYPRLELLMVETRAVLEVGAR
eukprot:ANDGO_01549.mRNA.1 hypothetical protein